MSKVIYRGASSLDFLQSILLRAGWLVLLVYLVIHYEENRPVILGFGLLVFLVFLASGNDEITIYSDKLVQTDTSIMTYLFKRREKHYNLTDIKVASLPQNPSPSATEFGIILILLSLLPKRIHHKSQGRFYLDLISGETVTILSNLGQKRIKEIVRILNSMSK